MNKKSYLLIMALYLSFYALPAEAINVGDSIDSFRLSFERLAGQWIDPLKNVARWLLLTLALISLAWSGIQNVLRIPDLGDFLVDVTRMVLVVGFFLWLIDDADKILKIFIDGWILVAGKANGESIPLNSIASIFDSGLVICAKIWSESSLETMTAIAFLCVVIILFYAAFAMFAMAAYLEAFIVTAASIVLLGFGSSQWTDGFAKAYFRFLMATGVKFYVLFLMLGFVNKAVNDWAAAIDHAAMVDVLSLTGLLAIGVYLVAKIPAVAAGMITGASVGQVAPTGGQMMGAAMGAAGGALAGGMAVHQAYQLAGQQSGGQGGGVRAAAALGNLGGAAKDVAIGRIMGDYKASQGSFTGQMAQSLAAKNSSISSGAGASRDTPKTPKPETSNSSDGSGSDGGSWRSWSWSDSGGSLGGGSQSAATPSSSSASSPSSAGSGTAPEKATSSSPNSGSGSAATPKPTSASSPGSAGSGTAPEKATSPASSASASLVGVPASQQLKGMMEGMTTPLTVKPDSTDTHPNDPREREVIPMDDDPPNIDGKPLVQ